MDGIFGIGVPEMIIILLVIFIVGGPKNSAKWAREAGRTVRKLRTMWQTIMAEVENELGPEGKELVDATRELGDSLREIKGATNPTSYLRNTPSKPPRITAKTSDNGSTEPDENQYPAWTPPDSQSMP
jgi:Sec-independent protein translocase protein TatA